jgi:hypothetical protein
MTVWARVKWTEAAQVTSQLGWPEEAADLGRAAPAAYLAKLREAARLNEAVFFLGVSLPRYEAVGWATRMVRDLGEGHIRSRGDLDALKSALLWVQDPTESRRRAAFEAAQLAASGSAERLTAMAAFLSGGSLTPDNCQPLPPQNNVAGRVGAGAILVAAGRCPNRVEAIHRALDAGEKIAAAGLDGVRA